MPTQNHTYRLAALYPLHPKPYTLKNFTFSAKERDVETGLSYFGSRYYSSDLSIWLSVDPQAAKYPGLSPFTYCANNPIKLVDPNGEEIVLKDVDGKKYTYTPGTKCTSSDKNVQNAWGNLDKMYETKAGKQVIGEMTKEGAPTFTFTNESLKNDGTGRFQKDGAGGGTMYMGGNLSSGNYVAPELFHGYQEMKGQGGVSIHNEVEAELFSFLTTRNLSGLFPRDNPESAGAYWNAYQAFVSYNVNESNFDNNFSDLCNDFKKYAKMNYAGDYSNFKLDLNLPSLIKPFFRK